MTTFRESIHCICCVKGGEVGYGNWMVLCQWGIWERDGIVVRGTLCGGNGIWNGTVLFLTLSTHILQARKQPVTVNKMTEL